MFLHYAELKLRYLVEKSGYERIARSQNGLFESSTLAFFTERMIYKYIEQVNFSETFD